MPGAKDSGEAWSKRAKHQRGHRALRMRGTPALERNVGALAGNAPVLLWNAPALAGNVPALLWNAPALAGNTPTLLWNAPALAGNTPTLLWNAPALAGNVPALLWNAPTLLWNTGTLLWNAPALLWNAPVWAKGTSALARRAGVKAAKSTDHELRNPPLRAHRACFSRLRTRSRWLLLPTHPCGPRDADMGANGRPCAPVL